MILDERLLLVYVFPVLFIATLEHILYLLKSLLYQLLALVEQLSRLECDPDTPRYIQESPNRHFSQDQ